MKMKIAVLAIFCLYVGVEARSPKNCGLSCFRWKKCMGTLNGDTNRPGQLGDTGIIVLQHCGPLKKKGCECDLEDKPASKEPQVTTRVSVSSPSRTVFKPRNILRSSSTRRGSVGRTSHSTTTTAPSTTESSLRRFLSNRSRIYRSKRLISNTRY